MLLVAGLKPCAYVARAAEYEAVSLNRKKSLSLSFTTWSSRALVELIELGLDQVPINCAKPFAVSSGPLGTGKAFNTGLRGVAAAALIAASGTKLIEAGCGLIRRSTSYETKKNVLSFPLYTPGTLTGPPNVPPKSFCRRAVFLNEGLVERK